jgi:hypothetical protein
MMLQKEELFTTTTQLEDGAGAPLFGANLTGQS